MRYLLTVAVFLIQLLPTNAQDMEPSAPPEEVFTLVEEMPEFPGGEPELFRYLGENTMYPDTLRQQGVEGRVYVKFVIDKDGGVKDAKVIRGAHPLFNEEALRVIKAMPNWKAGRQKGKAVKVYFTLPFVFKLE